MIWIFFSFRGDSKRFDTNIETDCCAGRRKWIDINVSTAQRNKIFSTGVSRNRSGQNSSFHLFRYTAFHLSQFGKLYTVIKDPNIGPNAFAPIALPTVMLAFETRIARIFAVLYAAKKVLICFIQILNAACSDVESTSLSQVNAFLRAVNSLSCWKRVGLFPVSLYCFCLWTRKWLKTYLQQPRLRNICSCWTLVGYMRNL